MTNHTPNTEQRERAEFEAWARTKYDQKSLMKGFGGKFVINQMENIYEAWHARATQAAPASPELAYWLEADKSAAGANPHDIIGKHSMLYSTRLTREKPTGDNPCWPMYFAAPASPNTGAVPDGWKMVPIEPTEDMVIDGFESRPEWGFTPYAEMEKYEAMSGCKQAAHRARLCYAAMLAAAPTAPAPGDCVVVPRTVLQMIDDAMQHMGDQLNEMDVVEEEDEAIVAPAFEALTALLATPSPSKGGEAGAAVVLERAAQVCDQQADATSGVERTGWLESADAVRVLLDVVIEKTSQTGEGNG